MDMERNCDPMTFKDRSFLRPCMHSIRALSCSSVSATDVYFSSDDMFAEARKVACPQLYVCVDHVTSFAHRCPDACSKRIIEAQFFFAPYGAIHTKSNVPAPPQRGLRRRT